MLWWRLVIVVGRSTLREKDQLDSDKTNTECTALLRWHLHPVVMLFMHRNNRFVFQQDNAWSYTACLSMNFLQANNVNTLPWPSSSPDMAPIEHVLDMINRHILENHYPFNSLQELENALIIEWNAIPQYKFQQIVSGMQKRCIATITANGDWTIYWHCGFMCEFIMCRVLQIRKFLNYDFFCTFMFIFIVVFVC